MWQIIGACQKNHLFFVIHNGDRNTILLTYTKIHSLKGVIKVIYTKALIIFSSIIPGTVFT
jgi:hypothetical protein